MTWSTATVVRPEREGAADRGDIVASMTGASHVTSFSWTLGATSVAWSCGDQRVENAYATEVRSAVPLLDGSGVAIVEPFGVGGRDNAAVYDADGSLRFRVRFPASQPDGEWFEQAYYVRKVLTFFAIVHGGDRAFEVDEATGAILRSYECR